MNLWPVFLIGLSVGGLTCLAVQGGLLAATLAVREDQKHNFLAVAAFLTAKLIAYTILGFLLGVFGQAVSITPTAQIIIQALAGLYMVAIALNLLNVHPIFRYAPLQPPRIFFRMMKNTSKSRDLFAPAALGALTIFIPCGTTLAMEALAISTASPIFGALTMAIFTIGTMPLFFGLGFLTTALGDALRSKFLKFAALAVLYLGITSFNGALLAGGSPLTIQTITDAIPIEISLGGGGAKDGATNLLVKTIAGVQTADISVLPNGYSPSSIQVKVGVPVRLNLTPAGGLGCTSVFKIPQLGITQSLTQSITTPVSFTPQTPGKLTWTCSMGMYRGVIEVI